MTQRRHLVSPVHSRAPVRPLPRGWRASAAEELRLIGAWVSSRMSQGFEWFLQLGLPDAATVLEMQNVKRRIPEIGEIDQAVRSVHSPRAGAGRTMRGSERRPMPFEG
jgi:hypothetical protein